MPVVSDAGSHLKTRKAWKLFQFFTIILKSRFKME
jgi:hypothetical protein